MGGEVRDVGVDAALVESLCQAGSDVVLLDQVALEEFWIGGDDGFALALGVARCEGFPVELGQDIDDELEGLADVGRLEDFGDEGGAELV